MVALLNTPRHSRERQWLHGVFGQKKNSPSGACAPLWEQLQNTPQLIYMSLNKNSVYCVMPRSSKPPDTCKWGGPELRGILKFSPIMSRKLYFGLSHKISNFMWHDPIHEPIHDLIRDLVRNPIRSDPSDDWPRDCRMRQSVTQSWRTEKWRKSLCGKLSLVSFYFSLGFLLAKEIVPWMERFITQMGEFAIFIPFLSQSIWSLG